MKRDAVREYIRGLNEDELRYLFVRLTQRLGSDVSEAVEMVQDNPEIDKWLSQATSYSDFFDKIDHIESVVRTYFKNERLIYEPKERASAK